MKHPIFLSMSSVCVPRSVSHFMNNREMSLKPFQVNVCERMDDDLFFFLLFIWPVFHLFLDFSQTWHCANVNRNEAISTSNQIMNSSILNDNVKRILKQIVAWNDDEFFLKITFLFWQTQQRQCHVIPISHIVRLHSCMHSSMAIRSIKIHSIDSNVTMNIK